MSRIVLNYSLNEKGKIAVWDKDLNYPLQKYDSENVDACIIQYKKEFNIK